MEYFRVQEVRLTLFWPRYRKNAQTRPAFVCTILCAKFSSFFIFSSNAYLASSELFLYLGQKKRYVPLLHDAVIQVSMFEYL